MIIMKFVRKNNPIQVTASLIGENEKFGRKVTFLSSFSLEGFIFTRFPGLTKLVKNIGNVLFFSTFRSWEIPVIIIAIL